MTLPTSNQVRVCTSCYGAIGRGDEYGQDPDGDVICVDCIPADFDFDQYDQDDYTWEDYTWHDDWRGDDDYN